VTSLTTSKPITVYDSILSESVNDMNAFGQGSMFAM